MIDDDYTALLAIGPWAPTKAKATLNLRILEAKNLITRVHELRVAAIKS